MHDCGPTDVRLRSHATSTGSGEGAVNNRCPGPGGGGVKPVTWPAYAGLAEDLAHGPFKIDEKIYTSQLGLPWQKP